MESGLAQVHPRCALLRLWKVKGHEQAFLIPRAELQSNGHDPCRPRRRSRELEEAPGVGEGHSDRDGLSTGEGDIALRGSKRMEAAMIQREYS